MLKPYEEYKETEYDWIGAIPRHWLLNRCSKHFSENKIRNIGVTITDAYQFKFGEIVKKKDYELDIELAATYEKYTIVKPNNLIINGLNLNYDFITQRVAIAKNIGIITSAYIVLNPYDSINPQYACLLFKSMDNQKIFNGLGSGIRLTLAFPEIKGVELPIPPKYEQDQIVRYLDWKVAKINKLIKAKKKQIELLKEQKQAIINQAVTKGLDPDVPMKDSGVEWLGEVPSNWEVRRLSTFAKTILSGLDKKSYDGQKQIFLCNYVDVYKNDNINNNIEFMKATASEIEMRNLAILNGDVIITKDSESWNDIAVPAYVSDDFEDLYCAYHLAIIRNKDSNICSKLIYYAFKSQYVEVQHELKAKGVTRFALGYQPIHDTIIALPLLDEQKKIVVYIEKVNLLIDKSIAAIKQEIALLTEYRTRLISDVVTGKIDVRNIDVPDILEDIEDVEIYYEAESETDNKDEEMEGMFNV